MNLEKRVLLSLHFRELALRFLDGTNPQPHKAIVIADAICSYDGDLDTKVPIRHQAHRFCHEALTVIEFEKYHSGSEFGRWLYSWNEKFGAK